MSPDSFEFICYDRFSGTTSRIDRVYSDWWKNTKSSFEKDAKTFPENPKNYENFSTEKKTAKLI